MNQNDETDQEVGDYDNQHTRESTLSSDIEEDDLHHQQWVLRLCQVRQDKSLRNTMVPMPRKQSRTDTVIARPPLTNSHNLPTPMAPPLLNRQKSSLDNTLSESDRAPSTWALVLPNKSSGDPNIPQPKASCDQNVPQHQKATFGVAKRFMEDIIFTKTPWPILSDDKYSVVEDGWKLAIEAHDRQWAVAGAPLGTPSVCQLRSGPSLKVHPQTRAVLSLDFCSMLLSQSSGYLLPPKISIVETKDHNHLWSIG